MMGTVEIEPVVLEVTHGPEGARVTDGTLNVVHRDTGELRTYKVTNWRPHVLMSFLTGAIMPARDFDRVVSLERKARAYSDE